MRLAIAALLACSRCVFAQLPNCEAPAPLRQSLRQQLDPQKLAAMKFTDRVAYARETLDKLIAQYPRESETYRRLLQFTKQNTPDLYPALINRLKEQADFCPTDPLALYIAGLALSGTDTPASIQLLEKSRNLSPDFAWPGLELARIYAPGTKRANPAKAVPEINAFFKACPSSTDPTAQYQLTKSGSKALQFRTAAALRARLSAETDLAVLKDYATLWSLEFRIHSPAEYPALQSQLTADLKRLNQLNPNPDIDWLVFLKDGIKLSGAAPAAIAAAEDRIIQTAPHSDEAYQITRDRWESIHKEPLKKDDVTAWAAYHRSFRDALKTWLAQFRDSADLQHTEAFYATLFNPDLPDEDGLRAVNDYLTYLSDYRPPNINDLLTASWVLVDHNWEPSRVFTLLQDSGRLLQNWSVQNLGDNMSEESQSNFKANYLILQQAVASRILVAARLAEQPHQAQRLRPFIERDLPPNTRRVIEERHWLDRGRLALLEGRKSDALTCYQKALKLHKNPDPVEGRVIDDIMPEARALWQKMGETNPPVAAYESTGLEGWQAPPKPIPDFELADLSGKTWRLQDQSGKVILISVWATWCGPCLRELPHIQSLYRKLKDRTNIQILTLSIDEDPGSLPAFMKAKGYTFPVLPAQSFVTQILDMVAIPQLWIIDPKGTWRWTGSPATDDASWEDALLKQLESVR